MAGHAATSAAVIEAVRFLNGGDAIPPTTLTNPMMDMGGRTFTSLTALANEIARSRVLAGAHFSFSTLGGQTMGRQIGANVVRVLGIAGCGVGSYAWGSACLPCPMDTYWPIAFGFSESCTACAEGFTSPQGAAACEARLTVALRANGLEFEGEASGDGGMMMPMAASVASAGFAVAAASGKTTLNRKGSGVIQLVQRNTQQSTPSGALAVVSLILPPGVRYAGTPRIVPPLASAGGKQKRSDAKPKVEGRTVTWRYAPLAAGEERVFNIKVVVKGTTASWLSFQAASYYLTPAGASGMAGASAMGGGDMSAMTMMYGRTDMTFNVPIN
jgi:hypothetical protein